MDDNQLTFLISLPRSGSTLLQKVLGSHSSIYTRSEPWVMLHPLYARKAKNTSAPYGSILAQSALNSFIDELPVDDGNKFYEKKIAECYLELYSQYLLNSNKQIFLDKTPRYYLIFDQLQATFPNAKFILLKRNPLAILSSIIHTWIKDDFSKLKDYRVDLEEGSLFFCQDFSHYDNVYSVQYEDFLAEPEIELTNILNFLQIDIDLSCLNYNNNQDSQWLFGDSETVYKRNSPEPEHIDKWLKTLDDKSGYQLLYSYMQFLGEARFNASGYNYKQNLKLLLTHNNHSTLAENPIQIGDYLLTKEKHLEKEVYRSNKRLKIKDNRISKLSSSAAKLEASLDQANNSLQLAQQQEALLKTQIKDLEANLANIEILSQQLSNSYSRVKNSLGQLTQVKIINNPIKKYRLYKKALMIYREEALKNQSIALGRTKKTYTPTDTPPLFSIITVTFNAKDLLGKTIESIINQTCKDYQLIIIDGNSTDGTIDIINHYSHHITYWNSEEDSGIYDAMNKGITQATGQWINFMNAGDIFTADNTLELLSRKVSPSVDVIYGDRNYIKGKQVTHQKARDISTIFQRMPFGHQSVLIKNEVLSHYKFNDTYKFAADYNLLIKLYTTGHKFKYVSICICDFLAGGESESGLRPYIESIKILLDSTSDPHLIANNQYLSAFKRLSASLIEKVTGGQS